MKTVSPFGHAFCHKAALFFLFQQSLDIILQCKFFVGLDVIADSLSVKIFVAEVLHFVSRCYTIHALVETATTMKHYYVVYALITKQHSYTLEYQRQQVKVKSCRGKAMYNLPSREI
jgi:hypothetical protein